MSEYLLHAAVAEYLRYACKRTWWHSHQSGNLSMTERMKAKRMGRRAGVPDFTFIGPDGRTAFIELKADGGRQTESQAVFEESARKDGALYAVCRSLPEVEGTLKGWGVLV
jgi:hypothetical protein